MNLRRPNRSSRRRSVQRGIRITYARRNFARTRQRASRYYDTEYSVRRA